MRTLNAVVDRSRDAGQDRASLGRRTRLRRVVEGLTPEMIEKVAQRVVALLHESDSYPGKPAPSVGLLVAGELARHLGVTRTWVYEHANQLGAIRLGSGSKARLRFDLDTATASMTAPRQGRPPTPASSGRRRPKRAPASTTPLLPISPQRSRGILSRLVRTHRGRR